MTHSTEWWSTFFHGAAITFWRQFQSPAQNRAETDFAIKVLGIAPGARVLDVPCGDGRIALELAKRGFEVSGIDLASESIAFARAHAESQGLRAAFVEGDMRELARDATFDALVCLGNSFAYMDDASNREFLAASHDSLQPGGRMLLHTGLAHELLFANFERRAWYRGGDVTLLIERDYDPALSVMNLTYGFLGDGKVDFRPARYRIYTVRELREMFAGVGLRVREMYGSIGGEPFRLGSQTLYLVAERVR